MAGCCCSRSYCRGVAVLGCAAGRGRRRLDAEFCRPRVYGGGLGSCGVAVGAGCESSCPWVRGSVGVVGVDQVIKGH